MALLARGFWGGLTAFQGAQGRGSSSLGDQDAILVTTCASPQALLYSRGFFHHCMMPLQAQLLAP